MRVRLFYRHIPARRVICSTREVAAVAGPETGFIWRIGKYIRLSREDGGMVSESVVNQDRILTDEIPRLFAPGEYEVVDTYIDDGTSGTTGAERTGFLRMAQDLRLGRINCVIVKNLSRAFRNSADQGKFLEEFVPLCGARFISLYEPAIDTFLNPEAAHGLEVSITGLINEQYAYKTSLDVRRTFRAKREKGEFIGAFAPYGYAKDPQDKNALIVDGEAAATVRDIFAWRVSGGLSSRAIARKLNALGVPNPAEYKRSRGLRFKNPHSADNDGLWSPATVARILADPIYTGTMRQGRQRVISYKVHRRVAVPESGWVTVEGAAPQIISRETFDAARAAAALTSRSAPGQGEAHTFAGLVVCAECGKRMHRRTSKGRAYYVCRTREDKSPERCKARSVREEALTSAVLAAIRRVLELSPAETELAARRAAEPAEDVFSGEALIEQNEKELAAASERLDELYIDWKDGVLSREQYLRLRGRYSEKLALLRERAERLSRAPERRDGELCGEIDEFIKTHTVSGLSRGLATALIGSVRVRGGEVERIEFRFSAPEGCAGLSGADFSGGEGLGECLACYFRGLRRLTAEISSSSDSGA